jgi:hypothetical protein
MAGMPVFQLAKERRADVICLMRAQGFDVQTQNGSIKVTDRKTKAIVYLLFDDSTPDRTICSWQSGIFGLFRKSDILFVKVQNAIICSGGWELTSDELS